MKKSHKTILFLLTAGFSLFLFGNEVLAAKFYALPQSGNYGIGAAFSVDVKIDSEGDGVNAAQAAISFNKDVLQIESVDKTGSVFSFWAEAPVYSNSDGNLTFIGGTINGVSGSTLQVLKIKFKSKIAGEGTVAFDDGAITIDDGTGANILTEMTGANFRISLTGIVPKAPPEAPGAIPQIPLPGEPIPPPVLIERVPTPAEGLPVAPAVNISIYPDPNKWYDIITPFLATWTLPEDITDVATAINANPNYKPSKSEKLFDAKIFDVLPEGVLYLHVRFKNKLGWGEVAHYRLAIDTTPPTAFTIESSDGFKTDNPAPIITFETSDGLSGLNYYSIKIGAAEAFESKTGKIKIPLQSPGVRKIIVRAVDVAGNAVSSSIDMETLPIESPAIAFAAEKVFF
ncbi:MAG: cohesin domain-containing protein, partial [Patescibacteria group bacterium]